MTQPGIEGADARQQGWRAIAVLDVRRMHDHANRETDGIGQNVTLAAFDHLFSGIAARTPGFRGLHRLAVDDARSRAGLAPGRLAHRHQQYVVDRFPGSVVAPGVEITLHRGEGRELLGQHAPLATALGDVEDRVDRRAQAGFALAPTTGGRRQVGFDEGPFRIGGVTCIAQAIALILGTRDFSPGHDEFLVVFANAKESQPLKSRNLFRQGGTSLAQGTEMTHAVIAEPFRVSLLDNQQAQYNLGVRVACLSNRQLGSFNWPDFHLDDLMKKGFSDESKALLTNPTIPESVLISLYEKTDCFRPVSEKDWLVMIYVSANNERINTNEDSDEMPDLDLRHIHEAIFGFLESVSVSDHSVQTALYFLSALDPAHTAWPKEISHVLKRWGEVEVKNYKGEDQPGWLTHLSKVDELRCLIAALYSHRSTDSKDMPRYFGSPDDPDIAWRCAFYAGHDLSVPEIEAGFDKDSDVFVFAVLKNRYVLLNKEKRALIEGYLSGRDMIAEYRRRCEQIRKERPWFDIKPVSEEGRNLLEEVHQQSSEEISWLEKIGAQNDRLAARLSNYERRAYWFALALILAICFLRIW